MDNWALIRAMALQAEIEAMKAANLERTLNGDALAYCEHDFQCIANQMRELSQ